MIGTTVQGSGSTVGRTDPTRWEQIHSAETPSLLEGHHPPCQHAGTCHHRSSPSAGGVLTGAALRARRLPRRPWCHPPWRVGPRPGEALARNMHKVGPAVGV